MYESIFKAQFLAPCEIFPAPFRWIYWIAKAVYNCKKSGPMMEPYRQDKQKYFFLLRELILNKQDSEYETSYEDKIDDLKKDIVNEMRKLISDMKKD